MDFWKMAYDNHWVGLSYLSQAVKTTDNPFGDISPEEYKAICGKDFIGIVDDDNQKIA